MSLNIEQPNQPKDNSKDDWSVVAPALSAATSGFLDGSFHSKPNSSDDLINSLGLGHFVVTHQAQQFGSEAFNQATKSPLIKAVEQTAEGSALGADEAAKSPLMKQTEKLGKAALAGVGEQPSVVALSMLRDMVSSTSEAIQDYRVNPLHKLTPREMLEDFIKQQQKATERLVPPGVTIIRDAAGMLQRIKINPGNYSVFPEKPPAHPPEKKDKWD